VKDVQRLAGTGVRDEQVVVVEGRHGVAADAGLGQGGGDGGRQADEVGFAGHRPTVRTRKRKI
jgi:hypothetical protein